MFHGSTSWSMRLCAERLGVTMRFGEISGSAAELSARAGAPRWRRPRRARPGPCPRAARPPARATSPRVQLQLQRDARPQRHAHQLLHQVVHLQVALPRPRPAPARARAATATLQSQRVAQGDRARRGGVRAPARPLNLYFNIRIFIFIRML